MRKRIKVLVIALVLAATMALTQLPALAATYLGGVELNGYCRARGYWGVMLEENKPWGWKCYIGTNHYGINMDDACRWQYGLPNAYAVLTSNDAYGWRCYV